MNNVLKLPVNPLAMSAHVSRRMFARQQQLAGIVAAKSDFRLRQIPHLFRHRRPRWPGLVRMWSI